MEAFETFVSLCEDFLRETEENRPYDIDNKIREPKTLSDYLFYLVISVAAGAVIAFFATSSMKRKLRTAVPQPAAHAYIREDGVQITKSKDLYLFSSVSRTPRPNERRRQSSRRTRRKVLSARAERGEIVKYVLTMHAYVGIIAQSDFG